MKDLADPKFSKEKILQSYKKLKYEKLLLQSLLDERKKYTLKEATDIIEKYLKGDLK